MPQRMLRTITEASLAVFATANVATGSPVSGGWEDLIQKLGALGLCAFMVLQNYRQQESLGRIVREKDTQILELTKEYMEDRRLARKVLDRLAGGLLTRPCLMGDHKLDPPDIDKDRG